MSPTVRALLEAARQARLIDQAMGKRLAASATAAGVSDIAGLARFLAGPSGPGGQLAGRLGALLAPPDLCYGAWLPQARLQDGSPGETWLACDGSGSGSGSGSGKGRLGLLRVLPAGDIGEAEAEFLAPDETRRRFLRQFAICQQLNHPHLIGLLASGELPDGGVWFVSEHVESGDLANLQLLYGGRLAETQVLGIGAQIAGALAELDRLGLVHRAVSPASVIVSADGNVKLANLFRARASEATDLTTCNTSTAGGDFDSTWQPPETAFDSRGWTIRSDVYALGCVLFSCLAGRPPFQGKGPEVLHGHVAQPPPDLAELISGIDPATCDVIGACLRKSPERRPAPATVRDVLTAIRTRLASRSDTSSRLAADTRGPGTSASERSSVRTPLPGVGPRRRKISLAGDLADVPMNEVLQTLSRVKASGVLELSDAGGALQGLIIVDGNPVGLRLGEPELAELSERLADVPGLDVSRLRARLAGTGSAQGRLSALVSEALVAEEALIAEQTNQLFDAITRRFLGHGGAFDFVGDDGTSGAVAAEVAAARERPLQLNLNQLLMEAARQLDELTMLSRLQPAPWNVPVLDPVKAEAVRSEFAWWPERAVLAGLDGATSLGGVIHLAGMSHAIPVRLISQLANRGDLTFMPYATLLARAEALSSQPRAAEVYARAALASRPGDVRAGAVFARCLAAVEPNGDEPNGDEPLAFTSFTSITSTASNIRSNPAAEVDAALAALTPAPGPVLQGAIADAAVCPWLALITEADGSGMAVHLFAADLLSEITLGKLAKPPAHVSLRKYPEQQFLAESQQLSRLHCTLSLAGGVAAVRDLGSANGTRLDGARLTTNGEPKALLQREHALRLAEVIELRLRPIPQSAAMPQIPGAARQAAAVGMAALAIERVGNRPELGYAIVRHRLSVGGPGADLCLPGLAAGAQLFIGRVAGAWLVADANRPAVWRPLGLGGRFTAGSVTFHAVAGSFELYH